MPTLLAQNTSPIDKERVLVALMTAAANMSGTAVMESARAVFGTAMAESALAARKEDMKSGMMNGGHGESYSCRSLMRAYVLLKTSLEERANAEELMAVARGYFPRDVVAKELAVVEIESEV